ncbi:hypothetical protein DFH06DRAFT_1466346 [Mycena polygramma]|nr:hypothetical protein DFH06DRAFT_1466346 [Mycena polygramma]
MLHTVAVLCTARRWYTTALVLVRRSPLRFCMGTYFTVVVLHRPRSKRPTAPVVDALLASASAYSSRWIHEPPSIAFLPPSWLLMGAPFRVVVLRTARRQALQRSSFMSSRLNARALKTDFGARFWVLVQSYPRHCPTLWSRRCGTDTPPTYERTEAACFPPPPLPMGTSSTLLILRRPRCSCIAALAVAICILLRRYRLTVDLRSCRMRPLSTAAPTDGGVFHASHAPASPLLPLEADRMEGKWPRTPRTLRDRYAKGYNAVVEDKERV